MLALLALALLPAATSVAVLPVGAEQLSLDVVPVLERLDADLRAAVGREHAVQLQPADVTAGQVTGARSLGVACVPDDVSCLAKLCALAGVDRVVQSTARFSDDGTVALRLVVVDKAGGSMATEGVLGADEEGRADEVNALVVRARIVTTVLAATPPLQDATPTAGEERVAAASPLQAETPVPSLLLAGVAVAATGGVLALGSGTAAVALDAALGTPEPYEDRVPKMTAGRALVVVAAASTLVAAGGVALIAFASVSADPAE